MTRKLLGGGIALLLVLASPGTTMAATYYYYEGIVNTALSFATAGYYMGCVSSVNGGDNTAQVYYEQSTTVTKTSSISGTLRFAGQVKSAALGLINGSFSVTYTNSTTWQQGTRKGGTYTQSPHSVAILSAYLWKATCTGQEKVRVETYPDGGGPPPRVYAVPPGGLVTTESGPYITYEYNSFTASFPSENEFHLVYTERPL
ncbi:MAG: hypothetical protein K6U08_07840 [Firmicutes bacterium]|nr:hypothetical protein [Bacillota bacterium]